MQSRDLEKIVINIGCGRMSSQNEFESKVLPEVIKELSVITGQKPQIRKATKSIAGFKLRMGQIVGLKVTLRRNRMDDFFSKVMNVVLPRIKDFRGLNPRSIDKQGALTFGIKEQVVFPEIIPENSKVNFGLEITVVPRIKDREKAIELYKKLGIPLKKA